MTTNENQPPSKSRGQRLQQAFDRRLPEHSLRRGLAVGAFWTMAGSACSRGLVLATYVIMARLLGKTVYGQWSLVQAAVNTFALLGIAGLGMTVTHHVASYRSIDPARAGRILCLCLLTAGVTVSVATACGAALSGVVARDILNTPALHSTLLVGCLLLFSMALCQVAQAALAGFEDFAGLAGNNLAQGVLLLVSAYPLTKAMGLNGAVLAIGASWFLAMVLGLWRVRRNCRRLGVPLGLGGIWQERSVLKSFALPFLLGDGVGVLAMLLSQSAVGRIPGGFASLGGYNASAQWRDILLFVPDSLRRIALPILSRLRGHGHGDEYVRAVWVNVVLNASLAALAAIPLMILSPWILSFYGPGFSADWPVMVVLLAAGVFQALRDVLLQVTTSLGRIWSNALVALAWAGTLAAVTLIGLPRYGVMAFAAGLAAAMLVATVLYGFIASRAIRRRPWHSQERS